MAIWCPGSETLLNCVSIPDLCPLPYYDHLVRVGFFYYQIHLFYCTKASEYMYDQKIPRYHFIFVA